MDASYTEQNGSREWKPHFNEAAIITSYSSFNGYNMNGLYYWSHLLRTPVALHISRSEQAQGSEFHPQDKSEKNCCGFWGPSLCNKKVNPEKYVPCGSNELLLSNVAHEMKEKLTIQNKFSHF